MIRNLQPIRIKRGMTQDQLAKASGIHRVTIARYETGKVDPTLPNMQKLASALDVTLNELAGENDAVPND